MVDECEAYGGIRVDKGNRNIQRKPTPIQHFPPQISYDLDWDRIRAPLAGEVSD